MANPMVAAELAEGRLCGDLDFSDPEQYCAAFCETPEVLRFREADAKHCERQVPSMRVFRGPFGATAGGSDGDEE